MRTWMLCSALALGAELAPDVVRAQLDSTDLTVARVPYLADTAAARRALGAPLKVDSAIWKYKDLQLTLEAGRVIRFWLRGPSLTTNRGLRVGDRAARVAELYHRTCFESAELIQVCWRTDDFDNRGIVVQLRNGKVTGIIVGHAFDP